MPQRSLEMRDKASPMSRGGMYKLVQRSGVAAGLHVPITPHTLRHAFGDFVAKYAGLRVAQALLGHASVETTAGTYVDRVSLDEMTVAMTGFTIWPGVSVENHTNELGAGKNDR
jgi:integrase/recombinase XerD